MKKTHIKPVNTPSDALVLTHFNIQTSRGEAPESGAEGLSLGSAVDQRTVVQTDGSSRGVVMLREHLPTAVSAESSAYWTGEWSWHYED
ncbi:unnamed protein product [Arctogadus glacialis]